MGKASRNSPSDGKRTPRRYTLYDRLNLSIGTVNKIIYALIGLILLSAILGMLIR